MIKGLLFDMDGTLVDNLSYHILSFNSFAEKHNLKLVEPFDLRYNGMRGEEIFPRILAPEVLEKYTVQQLNDMKEEAYRESYAGHVVPIEGLMEFLRSAYDGGARSAIGSSGQRLNVEFILNEIPFGELISASVSGDDVSRGKPNPDIFLRCCELLGTKPEESIVFEDAITGIKAGVAAGCKVVGITTTAPAEVLREAGAHYIIDDYRGLTLEKLAAELGM